MKLLLSELERHIDFGKKKKKELNWTERFINYDKIVLAVSCSVRLMDSQFLCEVEERKYVLWSSLKSLELAHKI